MNALLGTAVLALACALAGGANAHDYQAKALHIDHPFARATPPGATTGGAYLTIANRGAAADTLVGAGSPVAGAVEIHTMSMDGGVMRMRKIVGLDIPAGATVVLKPGGYHLMLLDLKQPLVMGSRIPVTLTFANSGTVDVELQVEGMGATTGMPGMAEHAKH